MVTELPAYQNQAERAACIERHSSQWQWEPDCIGSLLTDSDFCPGIPTALELICFMEGLSQRQDRGWMFTCLRHSDSLLVSRWLRKWHMTKMTCREIFGKKELLVKSSYSSKKTQGRDSLFSIGKWMCTGVMFIVAFSCCRCLASWLTWSRYKPGTLMWLWSPN